MSTARRISVLSRILSGHKQVIHRTVSNSDTRAGIRHYSSAGKLTIGDISKELKVPKQAAYVPLKYIGEKGLSQQTLADLRWMLQKDLLQQDIFLIGRPGPLRRTLAMQFLELTNRELEYVCLSRDTTESDLKQRREISRGTASYLDQSAVRAAVEGRVLILEGIEKAERNVLPVLNNLLENREMQLEDGRFLMAASRYDKLLEEHSVEELQAWKLVRVDEDFRVIALGLPVPRYVGNPLDPPLRSRFQARDIRSTTFQEQVSTLQELNPNADPAKLAQLVSCAHALNSAESEALALPDFPADSLHAATRLLELFPGMSVSEAFQRLYPFESFLAKEGQSSVNEVLNSFQITSNSDNLSTSIKEIVPNNENTVSVSVNTGGSISKVEVLKGQSLPSSTPGFIDTPYQSSLIGQMLQSHCAQDFCVIGPKGCGKSVTLQRLADLLAYEVEPIVLYQDMTSRDLLQQRTTLSSGDTVWRNSPLVTAALEGKMAILDGIHRIHASTLTVIHRLVHDRELQLYDGTRMLRHDRYDAIKEKHKLTDEELATAGVQRIHPSFRIVGLAEPPIVGGSQGQWLTPEALSLFLYHQMRPLSLQEEIHVIDNLYQGLGAPMQRVVEVAHHLRNSADPTVKSLAGSLSTRQLLRIARRMHSYPNENIFDTVHRACLARFLPNMAKQSLDSALSEVGVKPIIQQESSELTCHVDDHTVTIGQTSIPRYQTTAKSKVPDVLFFDIPQHVAVLEWLMQDFALGEHLLLVGNQGVGKNKLADRLLFLLNRPREYIQLHRDTTVQALTIQPTVIDGVVRYNDSPLVQAVKFGHVLVVDEADKAPTHVTCILKTLVESGEMILSDGRRIVRHTDIRAQKQLPGIVPMHPDFRMIVLANRPGFPFLGNDFFAALGDLFSCHAVDNPSQASEISLLKNYGPDVPDEIILKLVRAFSELRNMADQGQVQYPYSTREVVNIVKHLQRFSDEGIASVVRNVFDFDSYSQEARDTLVATLHKHGIPIGTKPSDVFMGKEYPLPPAKLSGQWKISASKPQALELAERNIKLRGAVKLLANSHLLDRVEARSSSFSEQQFYCSLPLVEPNVVAGTAISTDPERVDKDTLHVLVANPFSLYSLNSKDSNIQQLELNRLIESARGIYPSFGMAPLGGKLEGCLLVHDENSNKLLVVCPDTREASQILLHPQLIEAAGKFNFLGKPATSWKLKGDFAQENWAVLYENGGMKIDVIHLEDMRAVSFEVPFEMQNLHLVSKEKWIVEDTKRNKYLLEKASPDDIVPSTITLIKDNLKLLPGPIMGSSNSPLTPFVLDKVLGQSGPVPNRIMSTRDSHATLVMQFPELEGKDSDVYVWPRTQSTYTPPNAARRTSENNSDNAIFLPKSGQIVQVVPKWKVPKDIRPAIGINNSGSPSAFMEVTDLLYNKLRYIPIPEPHKISPYTAWLLDTLDVPVKVAQGSNESLVTVDAGGTIRFWETGVANLERSLKEWKSTLGKDPSNIQVTIEQPSGKDVSNPKYGKIDPNNDPHVGGNTWAGGTGGRDTAGLGGKGGPYRLDAGHSVYQVSQEEKDAVPEHVKRAAAEMGKKAFQERLREIRMSPYDASLYKEYADGVHKQVKALRVILSSLQAKGKERQWLRHQTTGELDDAKLIEGLTGEKSIYRRRAEKEPELGTPQQKPKRMKLVVDVSGSMYRFNSYDGRLDRVMESAVLMMEAFEGHENKFQYDIVGHSGESYDLRFVDKTTPPTNNKERLDLIKTMHAHAQFCMSGDHTLEATSQAIQSLSKEDCDEAFVIVLSDANLERYGIAPERFGRILTSDPKVNAYAIFIGSLGNQADRLTEKLPSGRAFVCLDVKNIPQIMQQIFTSTILS